VLRYKQAYLGILWAILILVMSSRHIAIDEGT